MSLKPTSQWLWCVLWACVHFRTFSLLCRSCCTLFGSMIFCCLFLHKCFLIYTALCDTVLLWNYAIVLHDFQINSCVYLLCYDENPLFKFSHVCLSVYFVTSWTCMSVMWNRVVLAVQFGVLISVSCRTCVICMYSAGTYVVGTRRAVMSGAWRPPQPRRLCHESSPRPVSTPARDLSPQSRIRLL